MRVPTAAPTATSSSTRTVAPNAIIDNVVGGSVQAFQNTGGVEIRSNAIDVNLQCKANRARPVGGGNVVQGNKEDQCSNL